MEQTTHKKSWTVIDQILKYLDEHPNASIKEIAESISKTQGNISTTMDKLLKRNLVKRVSFGHYISTHKNPAKNLRIDDNGTVTPLKYSTNSNEVLDLDIDTLRKMKAKYGKEVLMRKLRDAIELLE